MRRISRVGKFFVLRYDDGGNFFEEISSRTFERKNTRYSSKVIPESYFSGVRANLDYQYVCSMAVRITVRSQRPTMLIVVARRRNLSSQRRQVYN